ncbi:MAG: DNA-binding protein HU 1 [Acidimicrobiales bacterium]|nr:MAG: DNA-binding protein HU 1 [Acidimicrobiales bacterium]
MNKSELVEAIAKKTGVSKAQVDTVLGGFQEVVTEVVRKGREKVTIPGFLTFEQTKRKARTGRNPQTGETIKIPASKAVKITAGSKLRDAVRGGK